MATVTTISTRLTCPATVDCACPHVSTKIMDWCITCWFDIVSGPREGKLLWGRRVTRLLIGGSAPACPTRNINTRHSICNHRGSSFSRIPVCPSLARTPVEAFAMGRINVLPLLYLPTRDHSCRYFGEQLDYDSGELIFRGNSEQSGGPLFAISNKKTTAVSPNYLLVQYCDLRKIIASQKTLTQKKEKRKGTPQKMRLCMVGRRDDVVSSLKRPQISLIHNWLGSDGIVGEPC